MWHLIKSNQIMSKIQPLHCVQIKSYLQVHVSGTTSWLSVCWISCIILTTNKKHGPPTYPGAKLQSLQSPEHAHIHAGGPPHLCTRSTMHNANSPHKKQCTLPTCALHTVTAHIFWAAILYDAHCTLHSVHNREGSVGRPKRICIGQSQAYNSLYPHHHWWSSMIIVIVGLCHHEWPDIDQIKNKWWLNDTMGPKMIPWRCQMIPVDWT